MIRDITSLHPTPRPGSVHEGPAPDGSARMPVVAPIFNPRLRHDPELDLVVLEFRTVSGEVRASIPSARELAAYRRDLTLTPTQRDLDVRR
ncbi:hypothetical protein [Falsiroseomonas oryziterrae]|uniref:hypothetical protein n=1 Tax=Falsiroseomonas oryziterrae TaxID=2911368 RepID=UPI001F3AB6B5|nr:hypothetical protein [Roseomonas sp. NPKOSM-4]